jgi:hypothetical protein
MTTYQCLICNEDMRADHYIKYIDHSCILVRSGHILTFRIKGHQMIKLRVFFNDGHERLGLKVHYDEGYSEVWSYSNSKKIRINQIVIPDFMDIEKLKNRIRTCLVFV